MTTKEQLAERLNGREIGKEITKEEQQEAAQSGLVVVFGYSNDGCEFHGAIQEEVHAEFLDEHGMLEAFNAKFCNMIAAKFGDNDSEYLWTYETEIPHATFDVMEDGDKFCRGVVFNYDDLN